MPSTVCAGPEFTTRSGVLMPAAGGVFRTVAKLYKGAVNDGPFGNVPPPGRTHIDMELAWVNNTGLPQYVMVEAERGPWTVIVATRNQAGFNDKLTGAIGVNARADEPKPVATTGSAGYYYANWEEATSYWTQDRGRTLLPPIATANGANVVMPGETVSARYRVVFATLGWSTPLGAAAKNEAYARFGIMRMHAAPHRT